ncbi:IclR family transcriptional regulator [Alkalihalobacillus sp. MEB130]|uniref:IclR family transcriptional regulator n=1 Tax=Alkalihalobacillus sp. MEB130 TaxID=2976704 RepID=UPI0028DFFFEB|nr:IclR family transcriptional regulator [Alkalihalobacillus sp. MEB130]MDT8861364.1 IclR family transcriptional regulator [Alkalihalobacillus sp. MEB130]
MAEVIRKTISILTAIKPTEDKEEWSVTEISRKLNMPLQTVHRLLGCLSDVGFVIRDRETKKFKLGLSIMELGLSIRDNLSVRNTALPIMEKLASQTKESVYLTVPEGHDGIFIDCIDSPQLLKITEPVGMRRPLCVAASKKVILAFLQTGKRQKIIKELDELGFVSNKDELMEELDIIQAQGFALSHGETTKGTVSVAAPIFSWENEVVGSISVAGPEHRFVGTRLHEFIKLTTKASCDVSEELGWFDQ